jgi:hypothetical protein
LRAERVWVETFTGLRVRRRGSGRVRGPRAGRGPLVCVRVHGEDDVQYACPAQRSLAKKGHADPGAPTAVAVRVADVSLGARGPGGDASVEAARHTEARDDTGWSTVMARGIWTGVKALLRLRVAGLAVPL